MRWNQTGWRKGSGTKFGTSATKRLGPPPGPSAVLRRVQYQSTSHLMPEGLVNGFVSLLRPALMVDRVRKSCWVDGREHAMQAKDTLLSVLACLVKNMGTPLPVDRLHREIWGRPMTNPQHQSGKIYFQLHTVRSMLRAAFGTDRQLCLRDEGYYLDPSLPCVLVENDAAAKKKSGSSQVLEVVRDQGFIDNRTFCQVARVSGSTARHSLNRLVRDGRLATCGKGRATHYHLPGTPCARSIAA